MQMMRKNRKNRCENAKNARKNAKKPAILAEKGKKQKEEVDKNVEMKNCMQKSAAAVHRMTLSFLRTI